MAESESEIQPLPDPCTLRPRSEKDEAEHGPASGWVLIFFAYLAHLFLQHPRPNRLCRILRARENLVALGVFQKAFEYFLHLVIDHQLALSRSAFQTALDYELSPDFPVCTLLRMEAKGIFHQL